jgi:hypothetical protein
MHVLRTLRTAVPASLAPCLSAACAVHCFSTPLVVAALPASATIAESEWVEWMLWFVSSTSM